MTTNKRRQRRNILAFVLVPIILTCFCSIVSAQQKPNLTPSPPPGCSSGDASVIVKNPSCNQGCSDDSPLYNTDTLYFDWGVTNNGTAPTATNAGIYIYVDEKLIFNNGMAIPPLPAGQTSGCLQAGQGGAACLNCPSVSGLCPGDHTIRFVVDPFDTINESSEADNEYTRTVTIDSNPQPPIVPQVVSVILGGIYYNPWTRGSNIPINASFTIQFSMSMDTTNSFVRFRDEDDNDIPGTLQWSKTCSDNDTVTFIPEHALRPATFYRVHSQARSPGGFDNGFDFHFFTKPSTADATPPAVQTVYPYKDMTGVSTTTEIYIKFSEAMNPESINNANITLAGPGINASSDYFVFYDFEAKLMLLNKNTPFNPSSKYTVTITPNVRDLRGNWLKEQYQWSFTTGAADTTPPTVLQTIPADGAEKVSPFLYIHIVFSEQMDESTLNNNLGNIRIHDNTADLDFFFNSHANRDSVTFWPPISDQGPLLLPYGHEIEVTIGSEVKDLTGNSISTSYSFSFTVADADPGVDSAPVLFDGIAPNSQCGERWSGGSSRLVLELSAYDDQTYPLTVTVSTPPSYSWSLSPEDSSSVYSYRSTTGEGLSPGTHALTFTIKDGALPQNEVTFQRDIYIFKSWPILSSPANGASGVPTTPTFRWSYNETDRPFVYGVIVLDGPNPETARVVWQDFMADKGTGTHSISIPPHRQLAPNTKYYWAVFCQNYEQNGYAYSAIWSFTSGGTPPPAPNFQRVIVRSDDRPAPTGLRWNLVASVLGPSPADIVDLKVTGPGGFQYIFTEDDILQGEQLGLYFWRVIANALSDGTYTFTVKDSLGRIATENFSLINPLTPIPRVDSSTMLPTDNSYVNTTTPTFSWTGVEPGYYYRITVFDWNSKEDAVYYSDYTQDTQITVPPGYLLPNTPYKWSVDVFDAPWNNRSRSDTLRFSTGSPTYILDLPWGFLWSDNNYYNGYVKTLNPNVIGPLPNEVTQMNVTGPGGFSYNFKESNIVLDLGFQGILYGYTEGGSPANGTYTFNVEDKYGATESFSKDQTSAAIPIVDQSSLSPSNNAYLSTLTPTFKWAAVGGSNRYYRVKINDWMGRYTVYNSPVSTGLYVKIPSGILNPNRSYKWRVEVFDNLDRLVADNRSSSAWNSFTIAINISALTPVVTSFKINNGALTTGKAMVTLNNVATNGPTHYMASEKSDFSDTDWQPYSVAPSFNLSLNLSGGDEEKTVYFKVKNSFAESPEPAKFATIEALAPAVTSFKINNGALTTGKAMVTLNNVATNSPTHYMASEDKDFAGAIWQAYSTAPSFALGTGHGTKWVYFKVKNSFAESPEPAKFATIEALAPAVTSFEINNGALSTTKKAVTLNNVAINSPTHYMASEDKNFAGAIWQAYSTASSFALSTGPGPKTVYFKVKNSFAVSPEPAKFATIEALAPAVTLFKINNGALSTTKQAVTLNNVATGNPTHYMASEDSKFLGADWQTYSTAPSFNLSDGSGLKTVHFKVKNSFAESPEPAMFATITAAGARPVVTSVKINAGALTTAKGKVTLNNVATNSPTHYKASEKSDFSDVLDWQPYSKAPSFNLSLNLSGGNEKKTIYFKVKNIFDESPGPAKFDTITALAPAVTSLKINAGAARTAKGVVTLNNVATNSPTHYKASEKSDFSDMLDWQPYSRAPSFNLSLNLSGGNEEKTVYFKVKNSFAESPEPAKSATITALAPAVTSFMINYGALTTGNDTVTLSHIATNSPTHYMASEKSDFSDTDWQPYSVAPSYTLSPGVGEKTVYFKVKNSFAESPEPAKFATITAVEPTVTSFKINNGASTTAKGKVTLNNVATSSPTHYMASEDSNFLGADWQPYSVAPSFNLSDDSGPKTVHFKVKNSFAESPEPAKFATITATGAPPVVTSFKINSGAPSTAKRMVTLNNVATNWPMYYMASESPIFDGAAWQPYSTAPSYTLSFGVGPKTVYFKVKNIFGVSSPAKSDTVLPLLPTLTSFKINSGASSTATATVSLNNVATNSPTHYMASESPIFDGAAWQPYSTAPSYTLSPGVGPKTVYFKVKNNFSESAPAKSDTILPLLPAVTSFKINNGAASTANGKVTLNNVATNSPTHYMASEDPNFVGASWQVYGTAPSFTLSPDSDTKTVYFKLKNGFSESSVVSDTILLY